MNPLRALVLRLSRIPVAVLLVIILFMAGLIAATVTTILNEIEEKWKTQKDILWHQANAKGIAIYAVQDIAEGQSIPADALQEKEITLSKVPQDAIASASIATGRVAKYGISAGQIVSQHDLAPQGVSLGFESKLKSGMRAVTFGIDNNSGVAGFVAPDSHVDIIAMVGNGADTKAANILSDVEVIAVGQLYQKSPGQSSPIPTNSVTVSVSTTDTTKLVKAISASKLYLALRSDKDHSPVVTVDVTSMFSNGPAKSVDLTVQPQILPPPPLPVSDAVGNLPDAIAPASAPLSSHEVEVWSGSKKAIVSVPNT